MSPTISVEAGVNTAPAPARHAPATLAEAVVQILAELGAREAFGVSGGAMATLWHALSGSALAVRHFRHESGAVFAAIETHFASDRPVVVFTTTGPGLTNALTGLLAARRDGAKIIVLSAATPAAQRGRFAIQETCGQSMPTGLYSDGALFDIATVLESADALPAVARRLAAGLSWPGGFVAHVAVPTDLQAGAWRGPLPDLSIERGEEAPSEETIRRCAALLSDGSFAIWVGFGARKASALVRRLAERMGVAVMCSPRAKGVFPEDHPQFVGVTGLGGHGSTVTAMTEGRPRRVLVLGTRLGEGTSFWDPVMVPAEGFIHVDVDPEVPGVAYPSAPTLAVRADVGTFLAALLAHLPEGVPPETSFPRPERLRIGPVVSGRVRPEALVAAIQEVMSRRSATVRLAAAWGPVFLCVALLAPLLLGRSRLWADPVRLWEEARRRAPDKARPLINLGVIAAERGERDAAGRYFDRVILLEPRNPEALYNRGRLRLDRGDVRGAAEDLEGAAEADPTLPRIWINLGIARVRRSDTAGAQEALHTALDIDPGDPRALTNLAEIVRAAGRTDDAMALYRQALASDPTYAHAAARLGVALESQGDLRGALGAYRECLARGPATAADRDAVRAKVSALEAALAAAPGR